MFQAYLCPLTSVADGSVSGATHTTGHTVSSALRCIGPRAGLKVVSSFFVMAVPNCQLGENGTFVFADCAVIINPGAAEQAGIRINAKLLNLARIVSTGRQ